MEIRECDTCAKRQGRRCVVLTEMVGATQECWAWSDDLDWEKKVNEATEAYRRRWLEKYGETDEAAAI